MKKVVSQLFQDILIKYCHYLKTCKNKQSYTIPVCCYSQNVLRRNYRRKKRVDQIVKELNLTYIVSKTVNERKSTVINSNQEVSDPYFIPLILPALINMSNPSLNCS